MLSCCIILDFFISCVTVTLLGCMVYTVRVWVCGVIVVTLANFSSSQGELLSCMILAAESATTAVAPATTSSPNETIYNETTTGIIVSTTNIISTTSTAYIMTTTSAAEGIIAC